MTGTADPLINAAREQRYQWIASNFAPIPFDSGAARVYGALCASVRGRLVAIPNPVDLVC